MTAPNVEQQPRAPQPPKTDFDDTSATVLKQVEGGGERLPTGEEATETLNNIEAEIDDEVTQISRSTLEATAALPKADLTPPEKSRLKEIWHKMGEATSGFFQKIKNIFKEKEGPKIIEAESETGAPETIGQCKKIDSLQDRAPGTYFEDAMGRQIFFYDANNPDAVYVVDTQANKDHDESGKGTFSARDGRSKVTGESGKLFFTVDETNYSDQNEQEVTQVVERPVADTGTKAPVVDNADVPYNKNLAVEMNAEAMNKKVELPNLAPPPIATEASRKPVEAAVAPKESPDIDQQRALFADARIQTYEALSQKFLQQLDKARKYNLVNKKEYALLKEQFQNGKPEFRRSQIKEYDDLQKIWTKMETLKKSKFAPGVQIDQDGNLTYAQETTAKPAAPEIDINVNEVQPKEMPNPEEVAKFFAPEATDEKEPQATYGLEGMAPEGTGSPFDHTYASDEEVNIPKADTKTPMAEVKASQPKKEIDLDQLAKERAYYMWEKAKSPENESKETQDARYFEALDQIKAELAAQEAQPEPQAEAMPTAEEEPPIEVIAEEIDDTDEGAAPIEAAEEAEQKENVVDLKPAIDAQKAAEPPESEKAAARLVDLLRSKDAYRRIITMAESRNILHLRTNSQGELLIFTLGDPANSAPTIALDTATITRYGLSIEDIGKLETTAKTSRDIPVEEPLENIA